MPTAYIFNNGDEKMTIATNKKVANLKVGDLVQEIVFGRGKFVAVTVAPEWRKGMYHYATETGPKSHNGMYGGGFVTVKIQEANAYKNSPATKRQRGRPPVDPALKMVRRPIGMLPSDWKKANSAANRDGVSVDEILRRLVNFSL